MKQSCPECHTIVEIDEQEYSENSQCERECPLCGTIITFDIPAKNTEIKVPDIPNEIYEVQNTKIAILEEELRELKREHSKQIVLGSDKAQFQEKPKFGWNWEAFLMGWIWGLGNKVYWPLLLFLVCWIPYVGGISALAINVVLGIKGSELSWEKKNWNNALQFNQAQRKWAIAGAIIWSVFLLMVMVAEILD